MPRQRNATPSYLKHSSGQARAKWTDHLGVRRERMLPGAYGSAESKTAYSRLVLELATSPTAHIAGSKITTAELILAYIKYAETYYLTPEGEAGREVTDLKAALRPVRELYATMPAVNFGPVALKAVRESMIRSGLSRRVINQRVNRIRRAWKWATAEELIPPSAYEALRTVSALLQGRTTATERPRVQPVE